MVKKPARLYEYITGSWRPFSGSRSLRHQLAHHLDHRHVVAREQQALLAIGREAHVARLERQRVRAGDRLLAEALHVERDLLLPLRDQHARVEDARLHHRAQAARAAAAASTCGCPGADRAAVVVEHAHQARRRGRRFRPAWCRRAGGAPRRRATGAGRRNRSCCPGRPVGSGTCSRSGWRSRSCVSSGAIVSRGEMRRLPGCAGHGAVTASVTENGARVLRE